MVFKISLKHKYVNVTIRSDHTTDSPVSDSSFESEFPSDAEVREEIPTSSTEINEEPDAVYKDFTVSKKDMDELITLREFSGNGFIIYYDDKNGGCYSVKLSYFVEATEGWGTTLKSMANTFELLNS